MSASSSLLHINRYGVCAHIELNRPKAINALNLAMVEGMLAALETWQQENEISRLVLSGQGERGFCAGGDVKAIASLALGQNDQFKLDYFRRE